MIIFIYQGMFKIEKIIMLLKFAFVKVKIFKARLLSAKISMFFKKCKVKWFHSNCIELKKNSKNWQCK